LRPVAETPNSKNRKRPKEKKERGERAIATGGRVTKSGRIYEAESLQHKKDAMRSVTLQRLEDEVAAGRCIARNLTDPAGTDLTLPDKYRSLTESLLATFLENHKAALLYSALYYPERDYPHDCHDWSVTPYGKLVPWVRDFDMLIRFDGEPDFWLQFQGKGQNLWFVQLKKALQHKIKARSSQTLYLGVRKSLFDLFLRQATNNLARRYFREHDKTEIIRPIYYVSYTSVNDWTKRGYALNGIDCFELLELEDKRFYNYCYAFFEAVWPREERVLRDAIDRMKDRDFWMCHTTPVDPKALTSKEIAAEFGATLNEIRRSYKWEETEQFLYNEWLDARQKGFTDLKLPALFKPTEPKISSAS
jgi:hypothetical protein